MDKSKRPLLEAATTAAIIDAFRDVHRAFGFGYREYIYSLAMERDLIAKGCRVDREVGIMVYYRGEPLAPQSVDMIVNEKVIIENKATERLPAHTPSQLFSYLCSTNIEVGLVLHFGREAKFHRMICENRFKRRPI
ncbi:MAG: GxxExxY protein [bacterium]